MQGASYPGPDYEIVSLLPCIGDIIFITEGIVMSVSELLLFSIPNQISPCGPGRPRTHRITVAGLEPMILLSQSPKFWDYKYVPPFLRTFMALIYSQMVKEPGLG